MSGTVLQRYDGRTRVLHWATVGLIALLWGLAQVIDLAPSGSFGRIALRSLHISFGAVLIVVLVARVGWRHTGGTVFPPEPGMLGLAARLVHGLLYLLLAAVLVLGVANVWVRGDSIFGLFKVPAFDPTDRALRRTVGGLHELSVNLLLVLGGLHALAGLFHHVVLKDQVLRRMLPR